MTVLPKYPVYVPSKDRYQKNRALTIRWLLRDKIPFHIVVEPSQVEHYEPIVPKECLLVLPEDGMKLLGSRNWIADHAIEAGAERHWQLDDNIRDVRRMYRGRRIPCHAGPALRSVEDFSDRYENVGISGLNYQMFVLPGNQPAYFLNVHVYSCTLVNHKIIEQGIRWRLVYNDDTDLCLQALAADWCTVLVNVFCADKIWTMQIEGGNTNQLYEGDGRLKMARQLERMWPGVVTVDRRFQRPQHVIKENWRGFDTPLKLREGIDLNDLPALNEYGMVLRPVKPVKSEELKALQAEYEALCNQLELFQ